jgi:hypothetical protein
MQQRSPLIFWLLLAATASVDAVAAVWAAGGQYPVSEYATVVIHALVLGQLGVVCLVFAMSAKPTFLTRIAPWIAALVATLVIGLVIPPPADLRSVQVFSSYLGYYGLHCALLLAALWVLQRTKFWSRRTGEVRTWQFSLFHVLGLMTLVAVLTTLMRENLLFRGDKWLNVLFAGSFVTLAVASVIIWSSAWHWMLRLAGVLGIAIGFGAISGAIMLGESRMLNTDLATTFSVIFGTYYLVQALVLSVWLGCGGILHSVGHDTNDMQDRSA